MHVIAHVSEKIVMQRHTQLAPSPLHARSRFTGRIIPRIRTGVPSGFKPPATMTRNTDTLATTKLITRPTSSSQTLVRTPSTRYSTDPSAPPIHRPPHKYIHKRTITVQASSVIKTYLKPMAAKAIAGCEATAGKTGTKVCMRACRHLECGCVIVKIRI